MKLLKLIPDNTNIKFLRWRVPFYAVSILLMAASIALVFVNGLNLGVDFVGGQSIRGRRSTSSATGNRRFNSSASRTSYRYAWGFRTTRIPRSPKR